ncbi:hypothetical protein ACIBCN_37340 [Nocardia sp. NPDC051052]|uniref:hypothetical protein n=1 Tax=Nocardia sp. NPDC051052 TaxID=3364322 RepID=UPI00378DFCA8
METYLRTAWTQPAPWTPGIEFELLRPYFDLGAAAIEPPSHVIGLEFAVAAVSDADAPQLPIQHRPGPAFRTRITAAANMSRYAVTDPAALPLELRTQRWQLLCDRLADFPRLSPPAQSAVTLLLSSLGFYETMTELGRHLTADDPACLVSLARVAHARSACRRTPAARQQSVRALETVEACADLSIRTRLAAAITLVVLHARGPLASARQLARYCRLADAQAERLRPSAHWLDALAVSTYWRAVSFEPYLAGDIERTREQLDRAERHARELPDETAIQHGLRWMNIHPLLETRSIEMAWAGDLDRAVRYADELTRVDPMDGKTHIRLGDLYLRRHEPHAARRAYLAAAALGAPYASLAWYKSARTAEDSDIFRRLALACANNEDPAALSPLAELLKTARQDGDEHLRGWAAGELDALRDDTESQEDSCVPNS